MPNPATHRSFVLRAALPRIAALTVVACCACQWNERWGNSGRLVFSADGVVSSLDLPGPNPTGVPGVRRDHAPITEENIVEVTRVTGRVQVRQAGERGLESLDYFKPRLQTGPGGAVVTYPNSTVQFVFADDTRMVLHQTGLVFFGDPAKNEPWVSCERLTDFELTCGSQSTFGGVELPGGPVLHVTSEAGVRVLLQHDRYLQVRNQGRVPVELTYRGRSVWLRTADWMDLPIVRNVPERQADNADLTAAREGKPGAPFTIGEAAFPNDQVLFDPLIPKSAPRSPRGSVDRAGNRGAAAPRGSQGSN